MKSLRDLCIDVDRSEYASIDYEPCAHCGHDTPATYKKCCSGDHCTCQGKSWNVTPFCSTDCENDFVD